MSKNHTANTWLYWDVFLIYSKMILPHEKHFNHWVLELVLIVIVFHIYIASIIEHKEEKKAVYGSHKH